MDTVVTQQAAPDGVTITNAMMVLTIGVALVVELVKAVLSRWAWFTAEMKKPLLPLVSIGVSMVVFRLTGEPSWLLGGVILGYAAGGGYDQVSGILEKFGLKTKAIVPMLLVSGLLLSASCNNPLAGNPKAELLASQKTFSATVDSLTALQNAGKFTPQETQQLTLLIHQGQGYLDQWQAALKAGQAKPDVVLAFQAILEKLISINAQKGGAL